MRFRLVLILVVLGLVASACSDQPTLELTDQSTSSSVADQTTIPSTSSPASTVVPTAQPPTTTGPPSSSAVLDQALVAEAASLVQPGAGTFMVAVLDSDGTELHGTTGATAAGEVPTVADVFRIGSITKVFTAIVTLMLVDDGLVDLPFGIRSRS